MTQHDDTAPTTADQQSEPDPDSPAERWRRKRSLDRTAQAYRSLRLAQQKTGAERAEAFAAHFAEFGPAKSCSVRAPHAQPEAFAEGDGSTDPWPLWTTSKRPLVAGAAYPIDTLWRFSVRGGGRERVEPMWLEWEAEGDPFSEEWSPDRRSAHDLLGEWVGELIRNDAERRAGGSRTRLPFVPIYWGVRPRLEAAPFQPTARSKDDEHFLTFFTWPVHAGTGERLQWSRLPVADKLWTPSAWEPKGGFLQEATGWKPSALQHEVNLLDLLVAADRLDLADEVGASILGGGAR